VGGDSIQTLQEAIALLERSPARLEHARALVDLGGTLRRRGYRRDAQHPLRSGYELAGECGADALAEYARTELQASGVACAGRRFRSRFANRERTSHRRYRRVRRLERRDRPRAVRHAQDRRDAPHAPYRKLEITKRAELPEALADAGDQPSQAPKP
jgi:hypothetical protein